MRWGRSVPIDEGFLPAFSVETEKEAVDLLVIACPRNVAGEFVAPELAEEQTLENLYAFTDRLRGLYRKMRAQRRRRC